MVSPKLVLALIPAVVATRINIFTGEDCSGTSYDIFIPANTCLSSLPAFKSYRENGFGSKGSERIAFYSSTGCNGFIYDTYSYNGDYFVSKQCYDLKNHAANGVTTGLSIGQKG